MAHCSVHLTQGLGGGGCGDYGYGANCRSSNNTRRHRGVVQKYPDPLCHDWYCGALVRGYPGCVSGNGRGAARTRRRQLPPHPTSTACRRASSGPQGRPPLCPPAGRPTSSHPCRRTHHQQPLRPPHHPARNPPPPPPRPSLQPPRLLLLPLPPPPPVRAPRSAWHGIEQTPAPLPASTASELKRLPLLPRRCATPPWTLPPSLFLSNLKKGNTSTCARPHSRCCIEARGAGLLAAEAALAS